MNLIILNLFYDFRTGVQEVRSVMAAPPVLFNKYAIDGEESFGMVFKFLLYNIGQI